MKLWVVLATMKPRNPTTETKPSIQDRFTEKEATYTGIIQSVATARLTQFQRLTALVTISTLALDAKVIGANTDLRSLMIVNGPAIFLAFISGITELHARFKRKDGWGFNRSQHTTPSDNRTGGQGSPQSGGSEKGT